MQTTQTTKIVKLLPSQFKFVNSKAKEVLYSSGYGAGKSYALCYALIKAATIPNNQTLLCRKTMTSLRRSTLVTLLEGQDAILPKGSYTWNKMEGKIILNGGGTIYMCGLDEMTKIRSMNLSTICIDESIELELEEYLELLGRLRLDIGSRQIFMATNPATPSHWIYKRFFAESKPSREVIRCKTEENYHLPKDYIDSLKELPEILYKRYVLGEWLLLDRAVYANFERTKHIRTFSDLEVYDEYIIGADVGFTDPSAFLLIGRYGDRFYVLEEFYKPKAVEAQLIDAIKDLVNKCKNPYTIVVDPSQASFIQTLQYNGFNTIKANNDILGGISRVRQKFEVRNDSPDLLIDGRCTNLIHELESYQYKENTEQPIDKFNHALDALRYATNYYCDSKTTPSSNFIISLDKDEEETF